MTEIMIENINGEKVVTCELQQICAKYEAEIFGDGAIWIDVDDNKKSDLIDELLETGDWKLMIG